MFPGINPNLAAVSIRPGAPGIPTVGNITYTATQATIVFSPPDHNGGATIQSFVAVSTPGGVTGISTGSGGGGSSDNTDGGGGGGGGGGLGWKNNIAVTSGTSYAVVVGASVYLGGKGAVQIVWPGCCIRTFPITNVSTP